jgi:Fe-S cluster assembly protein SufD
MTARLAMDALRQAVGQFPADSLSASRTAGLERLSERGLPTLRDEDWKYTDLTAVVELSNGWLAAKAPVPGAAGLEAEIAAVTGTWDADWLVIANGEVLADPLAGLDRDGISAQLLSRSGRAVVSDAPLSAFNAALLRDGIEIRIDRTFAARRPVGLLVIDSAADTQGVSQSRIDITLGEGATASFIEYHTSTGSAGHYANSVIGLEIGPGARADYLRVQDRGRAHSQTGRLRASLRRDSSLRHCAIDLGGRLIRNDLEIAIEERAASAAFSGLYLAGRGQHIDNHTRVDHRVGPARSEQEYRGILNGSARAVWNGKAIVHAGADGTDAQQANHNLLLSEDAEIDAKPELEIYADDVKCSHGTTIGQLDETALYYLRTRGIDLGEARRLLTEAFAQSIVARAPIESLRDRLAATVAERLDTLSAGGAA